MKIAYFAHDLSDAAVHRRLRMLTLGGASVTPIGFRRGSKVQTPCDIPPIELGPSSDGRLGRRAASVVRALVTASQLAEHVKDSNAILARNLEMLLVAARARQLHAPGATLIYECLDIHRMLLSHRLPGRVIRRVESSLWKQVDLILTSSPAYVRNYFDPRGYRSRILVIENKVILEAEEGPVPTPRRPGPPWRIGWFGAIRCRKSLNILDSLSRAAGGLIQVVVRGRPSSSVFHNLVAEVQSMPYVQFLGSYRNPGDLAEIYTDVHFNWAVDYYEDGQNSEWLLPNRIYEGSLYGAVAIALESVETGRWLTKHQTGVILGEPIAPRLAEFFSMLNTERYSVLAQEVKAVPRAALIMNRSDCDALVSELRCAPHFS
jgi:succinoglycan biosynthesis protein ExoL